MDNQSAIGLLDDTFNYDFDLNRYIKFVKELFNNFYVNQKDCTKYIANEYKDYISSFVKIGDYENSKKSIEVLVVQLNKTSSRDRARTMQRNFIANWLGKTGKDAALVAFYGDDPQDWRFSFVKMEYRLAEVEPGKVKAVKELTPAKRYSFLVGMNEPNHTCRRQFLELVQHEDINPSVDEIEKAFSIDNVTKEFFTEYKELFHKLNESLQNVTKKDAYVRQEFEDKNISTVDFAKKLLGQIVFIYFLQKKGWLGVEVKNKWGTGPKDFMRKLFGGGKNEYVPLVPYDNFFNDILEPLFYDALANPREGEDGYYRLFKCKIPFLNGGLFEPINEYSWEKTDIVIKDRIFEKIFSTFDRFNFTVKEDEPLEKEVAVDPEMLGKVFENLLEVKDRKSKGAFYTPREIVHYMCQQSLINYLETNISVPRGDIETFIQQGEITISTNIRTLDKIKKLEKEMISGFVSVQEFNKKIKEYSERLNIPISIVKNKEKIDILLKTIKIIDPAVGSGAFPVGMMNEIVTARSVLTNFYPEKEQEKRTEYTLKRDVIENNLYGVDIEPSAVEITKLRFWLSLIVDELDMRNIKPLPNLDHKIMCGNSLLEEFEGVKLFDEKLLGEVKRDFSHELEQIDKEIGKLNREMRDIALGKKENNGRSRAIEREIKKLEKRKHELQFGPKEKIKDQSLWDALQHRIKESQKKLNELEKLQKKFFNEQNRNKKKQLRADIDKIEWELIEETLKEQGNESAMEKLAQYKKNKFKPFFLWKLYFAEVFQRENPGFDVVIANPPYVRMEEIREYKESLKQNYRVFSSTADLYTYFYERGINIIREHATLTFISSNKFMRAKYGIHLRNFLKCNTSIREVIDFGDKHMFEAITNTAVIITKRGYSEHNEVMFRDDIMKKKISSVNQDNLDESAWTLAEQDVLELKSKMEKKGILLKDWNVNINRGVLTGLNEAFVIDTKTKEKLCKENPKNRDIIKQIIRGRDIEKYYYKPPGLWLIGTFKQNRDEFNFSDYPIIEKHLSPFRNSLEPRPNNWPAGKRWSGRNTQPFDYLWYENFFAPTLENFKKEKIIWIELTNENRFAYSTKEEYVLAGAFLMTGESLKYLLAFLNSTICKFYFKLICNSSGMGTVQWKKFAMEKIPIPKLSKKDEQPFIRLVDQILSITKDNDYLDNPDKKAKVKRLEKEIDQQVYKLYGLTLEEIQIIEEFNGCK